MVHGVINIRKEKGFTSHDVVAKLRDSRTEKDWAYRYIGSGCDGRSSGLPWKSDKIMRYADG